MLRVNLSDNMLVTVFFPGLILTLALAALATPELAPIVRQALQPAGESGVGVAAVLAAVAVVAWLVAMLLGLLLGVVVGYLEWNWLDSRTARRVGLTDKEFNEQWEAYVDSLDGRSANNSYVNRQVTAFQFEVRISLAVLAFGVGFIRSGAPLPWLIVVLLVSWSLFRWLFEAARDDHAALAEYRKRMKPRTVAAGQTLTLEPPGPSLGDPSVPPLSPPSGNGGWLQRLRGPGGR